MIVTGRDFAELTADIDHFEAEFLALAVRTMRQVAERSGHVRVAAVSEEPGEPFFSLDDLAMIATFWAAGVPELAALLLAVWRASAGALRASIGRQRADQGLPETTGDDDLDLRLAEEYLASAQNRMVRFADVLWEVAREQLLEGFAGGESIGELRDRLMDVPGLTAARATRVARTEVVSASNAGSLSLVLEMGFTGTKTWLATEDARTRHTHAEAEGQTVDLRASFEVGTSSLFFPGDPSGAPEEIINCRCDMTYNLEDEMADEELTASAEAATAALSPAESAPAYVITLPELPDPGWFTEPELEDLDGPVTLTDQGRFYGWLAPPGAKHRSFSQDVGVPSGNVDYSKFMSRETITADGSRVRCGVVTMDCGHAPLTPEFDATASAEHYDNTCSIAANVVIGEKVTPKGVGTWVAGAALPGLSAGQFLRILSSAMSGDWRPSKERRGWYEFVAALLVPVPGFATERHAVTASAAEEGGITCTVPITYAESECAPCTASAPQEEPVTDFSSEVREVLRMVHPEIAAEAAALHASIMDT